MLTPTNSSIHYRYTCLAYLPPFVHLPSNITSSKIDLPRPKTVSCAWGTQFQSHCTSAPVCSTLCKSHIQGAKEPQVAREQRFAVHCPTPIEIQILIVKSIYLKFSALKTWLQKPNRMQHISISLWRSLKSKSTLKLRFLTLSGVLVKRSGTLHDSGVHPIKEWYC